MDSITIHGFIFRVISHGEITPARCEREMHTSLGILPSFPPAGETYTIENHKGWKALDIEIETEEPYNEAIKELAKGVRVQVYFEHNREKFGNYAILLLKSIKDDIEFKKHRGSWKKTINKKTQTSIIDLLGI